MAQHPQVSATISRELYDEISLLAEKESRSISSMAAVLLQQAIKERNRKKKQTK